MEKISLFWMRRDLRLEDNAALSAALKNSSAVLPVFIFDEEILRKLQDANDARVTFIHDQVSQLKNLLNTQHDSDLEVRFGKPLDIFKKLLQDFSVSAVYTNHDYEPDAVARDVKVQKFLLTQNVEFHTFKDQVIFEKNEILTDAEKSYTVYTPYKRKWLATLKPTHLKSHAVEGQTQNLKKTKTPTQMPTLKELGFVRSVIEFPSKSVLKKVFQNYHQTRDIPAMEQGTSHLGGHLRFGTISIRDLIRKTQGLNETYLSELIWREFFMQVLHHHPRVVKESFRPEYDRIEWRKSSSDFQRWAEGTTGYPLVDAGMRELNQTGFMHNRVRMVTASFLTKHLLIYWLEGERYFARKLLDFDLAANNGNWQWAAGTGCDAAPYFRIFNPMTQAKKFDPESEYIQKWVPEWGTEKYPAPMIDHDFARGRCLSVFNQGLKGS